MKVITHPAPGKYELAENNILAIKNFCNSGFKISKTSLDGFHSFPHWQIMIPAKLKDLILFSS
jgi:hypothetical protein